MTLAEHSTKPASTLEKALGYTRAGLSVLPVGRDKHPYFELLPKTAEKPKGTWDPYKSHIADEETIGRWFANGANVAVICGPVSGGLCVMDFDERRFYGAFLEKAGSLLDGLPVQRTGKGFHVFFRCPNPGPSQKLAYVSDETEETGRRPAIETKAGDTKTGKGIGYVLVEPSIHESGRRYEFSDGSPLEIPTIPQDRANTLLDIARGLNECELTRQEKEAQAKQRDHTTNHLSTNSDSVIDAFNRATSIDQELTKHGYKVVGNRAIRPGGESTSVTIDGDKSFHHNPADALCNNHWRDSFDVFREMEHGGDFKAAVKAAAQILGMEFNSEPEILPPTSIQPKNGQEPSSLLPLTDTGNAERLSGKFGESLQYVPQLGWMNYNDQFWERDELAADRKGKATIRSIYAEAALVEDDKTRKAIVAWAKQSESGPRRMHMLKNAKSELAARIDEYDQDKMLFNCTNGTLMLTTAELRPHSSRDKITRIAGTHFDPDAPCPAWNDFLYRIFQGNYELIRYTQRAAGYSLTGETSEQNVFMPHGKGANGKSTLIETIRAVWGDYAQTAEFSSFLENHSDGIRNDIAGLAGARFVSAVEANEGRRLNESIIKTITGGDTVKARFLHREYFEFKPQFKLWLAANHKPNIKGTDEGIWRRIHLVPFDVVIPEAERDHTLATKLRAELPGILAWAVRGCLEWQRIGLNMPDEVKMATRGYRDEMDTFSAFIKDCFEQSPDSNASASQALDAYKAYSGNNKINAKEFKRLMDEKGFAHKHSKAGNVFVGIRAIDLLNGEG